MVNPNQFLSEVEHVSSCQEDRTTGKRGIRQCVVDVLKVGRRKLAAQVRRQRSTGRQNLTCWARCTGLHQANILRKDSLLQGRRRKCIVSRRIADGPALLL